MYISYLNLGRNLGLGVCDLDSQLLRAGNDINSLPGRDGAGDPVEFKGFPWSAWLFTYSAYG